MTENSNTQQLLNCTLGVLFPGGGIEVLEGHKLVEWNEAGERIASTLQRNGCNHVAAPLDPSLVEAMRFPAATEDFGTVDALVADLVETIAQLAPLEEDALLLLAVYVLSTWTADCLPTPPLLNLWGASGVENTLVQVLECLCRRPLVVSDISVVERSGLPIGLCPTLIVRQPSRRSQEQLLDAAKVPDMTLVRGGRLFSFRYGAVVCTRGRMPAPALALLLLPASAYHRISKSEMQELTARFAPRLLRYRLVQHSAVTGSSFDCRLFAAEPRILARVLGAAVEGSPHLQTRIAKALTALDEECKAERSQQPAAIALEALLVLCHEKQGANALSVKKITEMVNAILAGRHDRQELTERKVGDILRNGLGIKTERHGPGYGVELGPNLWLSIHRLAASYSVLSLSQGKDGCAHCAAVIPEGEHAEEEDKVQETDTSQVGNGASEVHNVHEVHNSQDASGLGPNLEVHNVHDVHVVPIPSGASEGPSPTVPEEL